MCLGLPSTVHQSRGLGALGPNLRLGTRAWGRASYAKAYALWITALQLDDGRRASFLQLILTSKREG